METGHHRCRFGTGRCFQRRKFIFTCSRNDSVFRNDGIIVFQRCARVQTGCKRAYARGLSYRGRIGRSRKIGDYVRNFRRRQHSVRKHARIRREERGIGCEVHLQEYVIHRTRDTVRKETMYPVATATVDKRNVFHHAVFPNRTENTVGFIAVCYRRINPDIGNGMPASVEYAVKARADGYATRTRNVVRLIFTVVKRRGQESNAPNSISRMVFANEIFSSERQP